jgi:2-polyprenyl-6-methoxyphenol hydroxylase-like FAD-dependent oxidoreductase
LDFTPHIEDSTINYVVERSVLDQWLVSKLNSDYTTSIYNCDVKKIVRTENRIQVTCEHEKEKLVFNCNLVVGADGERSIVRKTFHAQGINKNRAHHAASIRGYYENVTGTDPSLPL